MLTQQDAINKTRSFAHALRAAGIPVEKVILFGSYAKNEQRIDSDIDVALVGKVFTGFGFADRKHFAHINNRDEFIDIETKTYSAVYFEQSDPFIAEIVKSGIEIKL